MAQSYHLGPDSELYGTMRLALIVIIVYITMIFSRFKEVNLFCSMLADCSVSRRQEWGHMAAVGTILDQIARCPAQRALPLMVIIV